MKQKQRVYQDYEEDLIERLKDPVQALSYLRAALADEDERIFLLAAQCNQPVNIHDLTDSLHE